MKQTIELTKNQKRTMRRDLIEVGRNPEKTMRINDKELHHAYVVEGSKIEELHVKRAEHEALIAIRVAERAAQQKEEARLAKIVTDKAMLRAKRESEEKAAIKKFEVRGFVPLPKIGEITPAMAERINVRTELTRLNNAVNRAKLVLRVEGWNKQNEESAALAICERKCWIESLPEETQMKLRLEDYLLHTDRNVTGSASFQK